MPPFARLSCTAYTIEDTCSIGTGTTEGELRYVYYGETDAGRLFAAVVVERDEKIRVVAAYDLDAGQKRDYLARRVQGE
jgi:uncharacterized DUF497 family protein